MDDSWVVYNDTSILVVNKPHGLQCEPDKYGHANLLDEVRMYLNRMNRPAKQLGLVNRLDRPVGGLVLIAKTKSALTHLNNEQEARRIKKHYTALVEGNIMPSKGQLSHFHFKNLLFMRAEISERSKPDYKPCALNYETISQNEFSSKLQIHLLTGRYHQIRAQFAFIGHPILSDTYYGANAMKQSDFIYLFSSYISFIHPQNGAKMLFEEACLF